MMCSKWINSLLILGVLFMQSVIATAQGFSKLYVDIRPSMQYASIFIRNEICYTVGVTTNTVAPYHTKSIWSKLSLEGSIDEYVVYKDTNNNDYGTFFNTGQFINDTTVKLYGYVSDGMNLYPILWTIDSNGTLLRSTIYSDTASSLIRGDFMLSDSYGNSFLTASYQYSPGAIDSYIIKADENDSILWKKRYGSPNPWDEQVTSLCILQNGNVMIGNWKFDQNLPNMKSYTWLFEIDSADGSIVRQWFDADSTMDAKALKQTSDGGFIYASKRIQSQDIGDAFGYTTIVKMDSAFNKEWVYESTMLMGSLGMPVGAFDIEELPNGDFLVCGNGNYTNPNYNLLSGWIMRLSSDGSVVWSNGYTAMDTSGISNYLNDIDVLADGSYIAVGYVNLPSSVQPTQRQQAWILKVDSNGCLMENCLVGFENIEQRRELTLSPNPASNGVYVTMDAKMNGSILQVFDAMGREIINKQVAEEEMFLDISAMAKGLYFLIVQKEGKTMSKKLIIE